MTHDYPRYRHELQSLMAKLSRQIPGSMAKFSELHGAAMAEGALSAQQKELIALGIAIAARCDGCITFHVYEALHAGATLEEIGECIGVAVLMGGGPSVIYGAHALDAVEQFQRKAQAA